MDTTDAIAYILGAWIAGFLFGFVAAAWVLRGRQLTGDFTERNTDHE